MRAEGSTLGRLREWSPSPAWPEGRGLMLLRPLLDARREALRTWLAARGATWIEDPANDDPRFARPRARRALRDGAEAGPAPDPSSVSADRIDVQADLVRLDRNVSARALAAALVCVGGGATPPRGDRLAAMVERLRAGCAFTATLCGARIEADGDGAVLMRDVGELTRRGAAPVPLAPGVETVWDGRWAVTADGPGWSAAAAAGHMAALSPVDRAALKSLPPAARRARPVLIRNGPGAPFLAEAGGRAHALVGERLASALDGMTHERDLGSRTHGAAPRNHLFSSAEINE